MAKKTLKIEAYGKTDIGRKRNSNQDSYLVNEKQGLFAVADGMGGHSGGEVASAMAIKTLEKVFSERKKEDPVAQLLNNAITQCNKVIFEQSVKKQELQGMGTTLTAAHVDGNTLYIGQVGDSRLYLFRNTDLFQITEDHSQVYELLKAGLISEENLNTFQKNIITRSVGYEAEVSVDIFTREMKKGDRYLICSDGLSGMVSNDQIARVLHNFSLEESATNLVDIANAQGGEDNISVILFDVK